MEEKEFGQAQGILFRLNVRNMLFFVFAFVGIFGGLGIIIVGADNGNPYWDIVYKGLVLLVFGVLAFLAIRPWTSSEKDLQAKLNPEEED